MSSRLDYNKLAPLATKGLGVTQGYLSQCSLPMTLVHLVYLRVSQINGCAYCIDKHSRDLLAEGMSIEKLLLVPVWHEAGALFDARERAALSWSETVTQVAQTAVPDDAYQSVCAVFDEKEVVDLTVAIALMNAYNRMGVSFRLAPKAVTEAAAGL
jgi:AhpD family alkylhydroperoxidase